MPMIFENAMSFAKSNAGTRACAGGRKWLPSGSALAWFSKKSTTPVMARRVVAAVIVFA